MQGLVSRLWRGNASMKIMRVGGDVAGVLEGVSFEGVDGEDAIDFLDAALDAEEFFLGDAEAVFLEGGGRDEGVGDAGFVFEADEDVALRSAGALTADHHACDGEVIAMAGLFEIAGAPDVIGQIGAQQGHGVGTGGEAGGGVVGLESLGGRHGREDGVARLTGGGF